MRASIPCSGIETTREASIHRSRRERAIADTIDE
jgi:hypothetical protein